MKGRRLLYWLWFAAGMGYGADALAPLSLYGGPDLLYADREGDQLKLVATPAQIREKRLHFGLVFQSFNLFPQYTALQNITLAMDLQEKERARRQKQRVSRQALEANQQKAQALLARVGLAEKAGSYPWQLSGGQQQRVAIARALALEPDILCFDEPTSALDPELTGEVLRVIRELKSADTTMIVVTHEMEFARHVSDRVIFMAGGVIEEEGEPEQVFGNPQSPLTRAFVCQAKD